MLPLASSLSVGGEVVELRADAPRSVLKCARCSSRGMVKM
jgi:hypothetical protein